LSGATCIEVDRSPNPDFDKCSTDNDISELLTDIVVIKYRMVLIRLLVGVIILINFSLV
jgi:hypothetical protein